MTINLGWHADGQVFLVTDTAITATGTPSTDITSFGETVPYDGKRSVEEETAKIVIIGPTELATWSGRQYRAMQFIQELRRCRAQFSSLREAVVAVAQRERTDLQEQFGLLLGACSADGRTEMWRFDSTCPDRLSDIPPLAGGIPLATAADEVRNLEALYAGGELKEPTPEELEGLLASDVQMVGMRGNVPGALKLQIVAAAVLITMGERDPDRSLVGVIAFLQALASNEALLQRGIGGAMVGARVDASGVHWMPSITHYLYAEIDTFQRVTSSVSMSAMPAQTGLDRVSVAAFEGVHVTESSMRPGMLTVFGDVPPERRDQALQLAQSLVDLHAPFVVFIEKARKNVVVVDRRANPEKYFRREEDLIFLHDDLFRELRFDPPPGQPGQIRFLA